MRIRFGGISSTHGGDKEYVTHALEANTARRDETTCQLNPNKR
jgi:hypothetical protein